MPTLPNEIIEKLAIHQAQIWQTTSVTVSEAATQSITFSSPLTVAARTADLYGEISAPMMVVQFAFASEPENSQVVLLPQDTVVGLVEIVQGTTVEEVDENIVADLRSTMEAIVQGICLSVGNIRSETVVATGLSIRFQIFAFPPNLQRYDTLCRTQVAVTGESLNGSLIWLCDTETAHFILGMTMVEDDDEGADPFPVIASASDTSHPDLSVRAGHDDHGLDLLLDIPLEVSVELGRVRMLVRDVVELGTGSVVEIDKSAGEPVDVMVNGRLIAKGEVVVIEDNFGVRVTEIVNPNERFGRPGEAA